MFIGDKTAMMPAGYSKTPLAKKLGIKHGHAVFLKNEPEHYLELFIDFPEGVILVKKPKREAIDLVHLFCKSERELVKYAARCKDALKKNGILWVSWPKGSSKIETDLKREPVREHLLALGLVDTKVAAIDEDWSGLKFMYRTKDR